MNVKSIDIARALGIFLICKMGIEDRGLLHECKIHRYRQGTWHL